MIFQVNNHENTQPFPSDDLNPDSLPARVKRANTNHGRTHSHAFQSRCEHYQRA